jgi:hypothetical protein
MVSTSAHTMKPLQNNGQLSLFHASLLIYVTAIIIIFLNMADGVAQVSDVDDQMRGLQIRHLLSANGRWFDFQLPFIAMPEPYFSPWSRLVDLPYVIVAAIAGMFVTSEAALKIAFFTVPLLMLVPFSILVALLLKRMVPLETFTPRMQVILVVVTVCFLASVVQEFSPGRIDHHNIQMLAMMMIACGLMLWSFRGGFLAGLGAAVSLVTGLEALPFVVIVWAGLVIAHLAGSSNSRSMLLGACVAMLLGTVISAFSFLGPVAMRSVQCDAFSAPYIFSMILAPLSICASLYGTSRASRLPVRAASIILPLLLIVAAAAYLFPQCLQGPYGMLGPLEREFWLDRLLQEKNVLELYGFDTSGAVVALGMLCGLVFFFLVPVASKDVRKNPRYIILYAVMLCALVLALLMARYLKFPSLLVPFFIVFSLYWLQQQRGRIAPIIAATSLAFVSVLVFSGMVVGFSKGKEPYHSADLMAFDQCEGQDMSGLTGLAPGRIISPQGLAMPLLVAMPDGFTVASAPFHRAAPGMRRVLTAFLSDDAGERINALEPFDYVAVCRLTFELNAADDVLYTALATGQDWPGLDRITDGNASRLQLFRIDHSRLR